MLAQNVLIFCTFFVDNSSIIIKTNNHIINNYFRDNFSLLKKTPVPLNTSIMEIIGYLS